MARRKKEDGEGGGSRMSVQARFDEFVEYVKDELKSRDRRLLYTDGQWHEYSQGAWAPWRRGNIDAFNTTLQRLASLREFPFSTSRHALWVTLEATLGSEDVVQFDAEPMLVCNNGTYFLAADKLKKHSPDHYATRRVHIDVDPEATCPLWLEMLERIWSDVSKQARAENIQFLKEWFGVSLVGKKNVPRELKQGVFLFGERGTGKSTVSEILIHLLGGDNCIASPDLTTLSSRFGLEPLIGKAALVTSEAASTKTEADSNRLKNLITGDLQDADRKGLPTVPFRFYGPVVFTTNNLPKIHDESDALYQRFVVLEFTRQFSADDIVDTLDGYKDGLEYLKAKQQLPGILNWALEGYDEAVERKKFTLPSAALNAADKFRRQNDRVYDFIRTCLEFDGKHACGSDAVAIACVEFVQAQHDARISVASASRAIARQVKSVLPGVIHDQGYHERRQFKAYHKLRLNYAGLSYFEMAKGKPYPTLKDAVKRVNYRYG